MRAAAISIVTNDAEQYLALVSSPEVREVLDREYAESREGAFVLFLRKDGASAP